MFLFFKRYSKLIKCLFQLRINIIYTVQGWSVFGSSIENNLIIMVFQVF